MAGKGELDAIGIQSFAKSAPLLEKLAFFHAHLLNYTDWQRLALLRSH
jgi:hypothetical protein